MRTTTVFYLLLVAGCFAMSAADTPWRVTESDFKAWMSASPEAEYQGSESFSELRRKVLLRGHSFLTSFLTDASDVNTLMGWFEHGNTSHTAPLKKVLSNLVAKHGLTPSRVKSKSTGAFQPFGFNKYPYFGFIPPVVAHGVPGALASKWSAPCFKDSSIVVSSPDADGNVKVTLSLQNPTSLFCR